MEKFKSILSTVYLLFTFILVIMAFLDVNRDIIICCGTAVTAVNAGTMVYINRTAKSIFAGIFLCVSAVLAMITVLGKTETAFLGSVAMILMLLSLALVSFVPLKAYQSKKREDADVAEEENE